MTVFIARRADKKTQVQITHMKHNASTILELSAIDNCGELSGTDNCECLWEEEGWGLLIFVNYITDIVCFCLSKALVLYKCEVIIHGWFFQANNVVR